MNGLASVCTLVLLLATFACSGDEEPDEKAAANALAQWLGEPALALEVTHSEPMTWQNSCLGIEWPARICAEVISEGRRVELRSPNGQPHYVHVSDTGELVWAPIWEVETTIVGIEGDVVEFDVSSGSFARLGRLVPGTTVVGTPEVGARVFAAETSNIRDEQEAPLVVLVILEKP